MESDAIIPMKSIAIPRDCISDVDNNNSYAPDCQDLKPHATGPDRLTTSYLPDDALAHILSFLSVPSLLKVRCANFKMRAASSKNNAGWKDHCVNLWSRKVGVCEEARELFDRATKMMLKATDAEEERDPTSSTDDFKNVAFSSSAHKSDESPPTHLRIARASPTIEQDILSMEAYKFSVLDAKHRQEVTLNDLCFDADHNKSGIVWSFRFKESAGSDWTSWDPWWNGRTARKLVFLRNGTILQLNPTGRSRPHTIRNNTPLYDVFSERTVHRNGADIIPPRIEMKWRFVHRPLDLPARPEGAYIRITVGGRDVPTYVVRRSPNGNWGFVLESCWGVYASYELASRVDGVPSNSNNGRRTLRRTRNGSRWVNIDDSDNEQDEVRRRRLRERSRNVRRRIDLFVESTLAPPAFPRTSTAHLCLSLQSVSPIPTNASSPVVEIHIVNPIPTRHWKSEDDHVVLRTWIVSVSTSRDTAALFVAVDRSSTSLSGAPCTSTLILVFTDTTAAPNTVITIL
ncbi:hypothetical protein THAPSDRAFT_269495 [Thalassiosira pseudonana CCMP1335]